MTTRTGKIKYLSLLDFSSTLDEERTLIIQPLAEAYEQIKATASYKVKQYEDRLQSEPEEEWEMGMTNHTFLQDQVEDIAFEFQLQRNAVATSLIMVAQSYLHSKFQNIVSAYDFFTKQKGFNESFSFNGLRDHYFSLGDQINGVSWAEAVKAGSNYARHFEEWKISSTHLKRLSTGELILEKVTNLVAKLDKNQQGTAQTLINLGFSEDDVFDKRTNLATRIVEVLHLDDPNEFSKFTSVWLSEVMKELHNKFDRFDV